MQTPESGAATWTGLCDLRPLVVRYLGRFLRDDAEIEDTAQETLLRAARFRLHLLDPARVRPWILRIALNVLRDRRRREARLPRAEADESLLDGIEGREEIPGEPPADEWIELSGVVVERRAAFGHLDAAISRLDPRDRGVLSAWYFAPPSGRAGADRVCDARRALPPKQRVFRARRRLERALLQRFACDAEMGWPAIDGTRSESGPEAGAACAGARAGTRSRMGVDRRSGG